MLALNSFEFHPFGYHLNAYDLLMFSLGSFVFVSILLFYYNRIPKSNQPKSELKNPIYQTKDIILQSNSADANFIIAAKSNSILVKVVIFILTAIVAVTPFVDFLNIN